MQGANDPDVGQALAARRFRIFALEDAVGKVQKLRRKLIALGERRFLRLAVKGQVVLQLADEVVGWIKPQIALGTDHAIAGNLHGAEVARKGGHTVAGKTQNRAGHLLDLAEAFLAIVGADRENLRWLGLEQIARGIDAVDADVVQRAAAGLLAQTNVAGFDLLSERGIEQTHVAKLSRLY